MPSFLKNNLNYCIGMGGYTHSRLAEVKHVNNVDILFLGSSHAYRGFDTRIFSENGMKTFNLGSSSQTPVQTKVLLNRYLNKLNPKKIVFEVYPETFMLDGVESSLDLISNDRNDLYSFMMMLKLKNIKVFNTFIYAIIQDLFRLNQSFNEPLRMGDDNYVSGGFVQKDLAFYKKSEHPEKTISFNPVQMEAFHEIISIINERKIGLILIYAPITRAEYISYNNNEYFDNVMANYGTYINFNKEIIFDDSLHFYDSHHLNQHGVMLFNHKMIDNLFKHL